MVARLGLCSLELYHLQALNEYLRRSLAASAYHPVEVVTLDLCEMVEAGEVAVYLSRRDAPEPSIWAGQWEGQAVVYRRSNRRLGVSTSLESEDVLW